MNNKIRQIRNALGLNQSEFGEKLGVSRSVIVNAELGRANINDLFVNHLIEVYNVNPEWFKTGNGELYVLRGDQAWLLCCFAEKSSGKRDSYERYIPVARKRLSELLEVENNV